MYIKERVWSKLQGWKEQLLSQASREVLLKVVVQAILTYAMSCFKLPITLCNDIEQLIRKFWWGLPWKPKENSLDQMEHIMSSKRPWCYGLQGVTKIQ